MIILGIFNYAAALLMILFGIFAMIACRNLVRKVIGMGIMQVGVILFYISLAYKWGAALPIVPHTGHHEAIDPAHYANPLPHALMLTAIVVGVSLLGLALVLISSLYKIHGSIEEDDILRNLEKKA